MSAVRCRCDSTPTPVARLPIACPLAWPTLRPRPWSGQSKQAFTARTTTAFPCIPFFTADPADGDADVSARLQRLPARPAQPDSHCLGDTVSGVCRRTHGWGCLPTAFPNPSSSISVLASCAARKEAMEGGPS
jgi:hypothetical protein